MKRKNLISLLALALCALLALTACGKEDAATTALEQQVAALTQENAALKEQIDVLTRQLESIQSAVLVSWDLTATASADRSDATISFTAVPATNPEGQTVSLVVTLNGFEAESVLCAPNGDSYHATLTLPAADGYSYYCLISNASGAQQQIPLITPDNTQDLTLINLSSSLSGYGNLMVESWSYKNDTLTIQTGYYQVQLPLISESGSAVTALKAELVLMHNGQELARQELPLTAGEAEGTYESAIADISFTTPKLEDDHQLDLVLEITLSSGSPLSNSSCSWYCIDGGLTMVVG